MKVGDLVTLSEYGRLSSYRQTEAEGNFVGIITKLVPWSGGVNDYVVQWAASVQPQNRLTSAAYQRRELKYVRRKKKSSELKRMFFV